MKVLVVGAGALGQVFGRWLTDGGAEVSYLVRQGRGAWPEDGRTVVRLRRLAGPVLERLRPAHVLTELTDGHWDAVWLCVPSTALDGPWLADLHARVGTATIVTIGQDPRDRATLERTWPAERIVAVMPAVLAFQAPPAGEVPVAGIAYWLPPGASQKVSGAADRVTPVVAALRAGGVRARNVGPVGSGEAVAARTVPYVAALEVAGWSLPALRATLRPPGEAANEAATVVAALTGGDPPRRPVPPWLVGLALRLLPRLVPFDLVRYLEAHFTKVAAQTRQMLDGWIAEGTSRGLAVARLEELRRALPVEATR